MRILHVTDAYLPRLGGIEMHVRDLARAQVAAGDEVDILTLTRSDSPQDDPVKVSVVRPGEQDGLADKARFMLRHRTDGALGDYDVVHGHCSTISPLSFLTCATADSARLMTVHSLWRRYTPIYRVSDRLMHWSDLPVTWSAVSREAAEEVRSAVRGRFDVAVLPNGIDLDVWGKIPRVADPGTLRIVAVMRLATRKRPIALLRILRMLRSAVPPGVGVKAVVLGEGPSRPAMERYLTRHGMHDWVSLPGHVSRAEVKDVMARSDVFVAPAVLESFGIAALEAQAAGLPVVGRTGTGLSDFIRDGEGGVLVGSDRQMADTLAGMAINGDHEKFATSAKLEDFRWPAILERHRQLYEVAAARQRSLTGAYPNGLAVR